MKEIIRAAVFGLAAFGVCLIAQEQLIAQGSPAVNYRIHWVTHPVTGDSLELKHLNDRGVGVGYWYPTEDRPEGFIYDLNGVIDPAITFHDLRTFLEPDLPVELSPQPVDVNNLGIGVALVRDEIAGVTKGIWFDLATRAWDFVPEPEGGSDRYYGRHINNFGEVVVVYGKSNDEYEAYVYNPTIANDTPEYLGFELDNSTVQIADSGQVVGDLAGVDQDFRWSPGNLELLPQEFSWIRDVNGFGDVTGQFKRTIRKNRFAFDAYVYRTETDFDILPEMTCFGAGINDAGDVAGILDDDGH